MIPHETIQLINDTADIVEVVSDFITLRKRGVNYIGLCPFHNEKTPSFTVSPSKGICKCFGCGKGGNAVNFIMEHEHLTYVEALRYLAKKYNINIVEKEETETEKQEKNERESMMIVSAFAQKYFTKILHQDSEGMSIGFSYLRERNFRPEVIKHFEVGYCKDSWSDFSDTAAAEGYEGKFLLETGLSVEGKKGLVDRFRGRVIFPIHSVSGRVIGFGGRILSQDKKTAKYLNSPESKIYNKSKVLYGLFYAKNSIVQKNKCYLVEGYTDVMSLYQSGITNVVSSSGTALTIGQILLIKRFTSNITVLFDGDTAGIKAALRGVDMLLQQGMNVRVLLLPDGEDPDSFAKKHSSSELEQYIGENEEDFIHFKTGLLIEDAVNDPVKRATLVRDVLQSISVIPDAITRSVYIKSCSNLLDIQESVVYSQVAKMITQQQKGTPSELPIKSPKPVEVDAKDLEERAIVRLLLNYGTHIIQQKEEQSLTVGAYILDELLKDKITFSNEVYQKIITDFQKECATPNFRPNVYFRDHQDPEIARLAIDLLTEPYSLSQIWTRNNAKIELEEHRLKEIVPKTILQYKYKIIRENLKNLNLKIKKCTDDELLVTYLQEKQYLNELKRLIAEHIGERTITL